MHLKTAYDVSPWCSSQYSDKNTNALSRIVNSMIEALNSKFYLPDYVIVFLDDDLIEFLQYKKFGVAALLGSWIEYLAQFIVEVVETRCQDLPVKARPTDKTQVYFVEPINHSNFDYINQQVRQTYTNCLEATAKLHESMRVLKL